MAGTFFYQGEERCDSFHNPGHSSRRPRCAKLLNQMLWWTNASSDNAMSKDSEDLCEFCKRGHLIKRTEEISFQQWSDKGYVFCSATIPTGICDHCGFKVWEDAAESILEQTFEEQYGRLPPGVMAS